MKNTILLVILLLGVLARGASAQDDPPAPKDGQSYPVGTTLKAVCDPHLAHEESTWTNFQWWDEKRGGWNSDSPSVPQNKDKCFARFNTPGKYRMLVVHGRWDHDERHEIVAEFTIRELTHCEAEINLQKEMIEVEKRVLDLSAAAEQQAKNQWQGAVNRQIACFSKPRDNVCAAESKAVEDATDRLNAKLKVRKKDEAKLNASRDALAKLQKACDDAGDGR